MGQAILEDEEFRREVAEAARTRTDIPLADRMWARVTAYGNLNWRIFDEPIADH
jgi:hypothetical protein